MTCNKRKTKTISNWMIAGSLGLMLGAPLAAYAAAANPCAANPAAGKKNPCAAKNPCSAKNPCAAKNPCSAKNPCAAKDSRTGWK